MLADIKSYFVHFGQYRYFIREIVFHRICVLYLVTSGRKHTYNGNGKNKLFHFVMGLKFRPTSFLRVFGSLSSLTLYIVPKNNPLSLKKSFSVRYILYENGRAAQSKKRGKT